MRKLIKRYQLGGVPIPKGPFNFSGSSTKPSVGSGLTEKTLSAARAAASAAGSSGGDSGGGEGLFQGTAGWGQGLAMIGDIGSTFIPKKKQAALTEALNSGYDAASSAIMTLGPAGALAGGIMKAAGLVSDGLTALGVGTDGLTTTDRILDSKFLKLSPIGLANAIGASTLAKRIGGQDVNDAIALSGGGYGGVMEAWDEAGKYSGKKVGLLNSKSGLNNRIYEANSQMHALQRIMGDKRNQDILTAQMGDRWNQSIENNMNGGIGNIMFGRLGLKVEILPKVHAILNAPKVVDTLSEFEEVQEFKEGGKMNVIPEGSLHARLHHMENAEGLTKKGIPVVSIAEGGELEQQAEIELNEIIFNLDVTTKLEKLMEDGSDNAAIEAGKLLVKEIFENTDDRTGLIKQLEPEKKEPITEDIVKNHQVFQQGGNIKPSFEEWYKTVPQDRNNIENYNLKRAYELAPWEELERWRTATPEQLKDDKYHLRTFYWNDKGEGEFVKKNGHPTLIKELEAYFTNKDFREKYDLDMSGDYFKYIKKK